MSLIKPIDLTNVTKVIEGTYEGANSTQMMLNIKQTVELIIITATDSEGTSYFTIATRTFGKSISGYITSDNQTNLYSGNVILINNIFRFQADNALHTMNASGITYFYKAFCL